MGAKSGTLVSVIDWAVAPAIGTVAVAHDVNARCDGFSTPTSRKGEPPIEDHLLQRVSHNRTTVLTRSHTSEEPLIGQLAESGRQVDARVTSSSRKSPHPTRTSADDALSSR